MFVGLVTAFMAGGATTKPPIVNMWCGVIAFTSFTLVFSQFHKIKKMGSAILIGLIGGSLGHLIWIFCDQFQIGYAEKRNLTTAISFAEIPDFFPFNAMYDDMMKGARGIQSGLSWQMVTP